ncbi:ABC transporter substrate-binding protein [Tardiphaga sp. 37S4]|uniref:ABC transporter substrate-binding protein n=1 Tax=Tardiphaga sp. 37S4 TaxID=1404741 RepID=UPI001E2F093E|nr:ABC transporter substrate-binding protein [Tardiphaga sp. 37S4]UFS76326.1 ABC transporter substrate-binding protein [Tardiphaga sp. 37S4]
MRPHKASICATLFALALALPASAQQTIKIGSSLGLTGYGSATDGHWRDGMQIAIEAVNAQGGVLGKKLELVIEDNKSTPQQAVVVYRKMMTDDKVAAFDSGCISAGNFAAASFVSRAKLPMFLCSILPRQPDEQKWAFQFLPPPKFEVDARYRYLKDKTDIRKVGILSDPSPYSLLMRGLAEKGAEEFGLTVVANESYQQDDADFSVQIGRINAAGAGAIIMLGQGNAVVTVVNNIRSLGLTKMLMLGSINELDILLSAGKVLGDQYLIPSPLIQVAADDINVITDPTARAAAEPFVRAMKAKFGKSDNAQASRAWDSIMMMAAAMKKANSTDGTAVRDAFEKLGHYDGAGASYDFSAENHIGIIKNPYVIAFVKDGVLVLKK